MTNFCYIESYWYCQQQSIYQGLARIYEESNFIEGERWDSNPRMVVPQTTALTTWLRSPLTI